MWREPSGQEDKTHIVQCSIYFFFLFLFFSARSCWHLFPRLQTRSCYMQSALQVHEAGNHHSSWKLLPVHKVDLRESIGGAKHTKGGLPLKGRVQRWNERQLYFFIFSFILRFLVAQNGNPAAGSSFWDEHLRSKTPPQSLIGSFCTYRYLSLSVLWGCLLNLERCVQPPWFHGLSVNIKFGTNRPKSATAVYNFTDPLWPQWNTVLTFRRHSWSPCATQYWRKTAFYFHVTLGQLSIVICTKIQFSLQTIAEDIGYWMLLWHRGSGQMELTGGGLKNLDVFG